MKNTNDASATETTTRALPIASTTPVYTNAWKAAYGFDPESPLVVSYGRGVDSTAMLVEMQRRGIRPDLIIFSDVGGERPETTDPVALAGVDAWLESVGFPTVTTVAYHVKAARYFTLEGNCLQNDVLPSLSYGGHSCSLKWKIDAIDDAVWGVRGWEPALDALRAGRQTIRAVGYDASGADCKRFAKVDRRTKADKAAGKWSPWLNWYPLRAWDLDRAKLKAITASVPELAATFREANKSERACPIKSSCFFCAAMKPAEVEDLARKHPELALRAIVMEFRAETGKHGLTTINGLGLGREKGARKGSRNWSWRRFLLERDLLGADWREQAEAAGLLPERAEWDAYSAEGLAARERIDLARLVEEAALVELDADDQEAIAKAKAPELRRIMAAQEALGGERGRAWLDALAARKVVEKAKREMIGPDWREVALPENDKAEAKARREAMKLWRELVKAAEAKHAGA